MFLAQFTQFWTVCCIFLIQTCICIIFGTASLAVLTYGHSLWTAICAAAFTAAPNRGYSVGRARILGRHRAGDRVFVANHVALAHPQASHNLFRRAF